MASKTTPTPPADDAAATPTPTGAADLLMRTQTGDLVQRRNDLQGNWQIDGVATMPPARNLVPAVESFFIKDEPGDHQDSFAYFSQEMPDVVRATLATWGLRQVERGDFKRFLIRWMDQQDTIETRY